MSLLLVANKYSARSQGIGGGVGVDGRLIPYPICNPEVDFIPQL